MTRVSCTLCGALREAAGDFKRALYSQWTGILQKQRQLKTLGLLVCGMPAPFAWKMSPLSLILSAAILWGNVTACGHNPAQKSLGQDKQDVFSKLNHWGIARYCFSSCLSLSEGGQQHSLALLPAIGTHHISWADIIKSCSYIASLIRLVISALPLCFVRVAFQPERARARSMCLKVVEESRSTSVTVAM